MNYYHMTSLDNLYSISARGLLPANGSNGRLIGEDKVKVFFSEGFEGAIALFVDFDIVFEKIKKGQMEVSDELVKGRVLKAKGLSDYLGEGVYLRFDGAGIKNERNFENGCTGMVIPPEKLSVCILRRKGGGSIIFSRFEIIKYMMAKISPGQIRYYGAEYAGSPGFDAATARIREKVKAYYRKHQTEINEYAGGGFALELIGLKDFMSLYESQAFYKKMGCVEAEQYNREHVDKEPYDCQLECKL